MKTHVITISRVYPKGHWREGAKTFFENKIDRGEKIHTIRKVGKWPQRIKDVQEGKAILSVREWTGEPYNSPQKELFQFTAADEVGFEICEYDEDCIMVCDEKKIYCNSFETVAKNDGLKLPDFESWFQKVKPSTEMIIIHFTKFRYAV